MRSHDVPALIFGSGLTALGALRSLGRTGALAYSVCGPKDLAARSRWYRPAPRLRQRNPVPDELGEYLESLPFPTAVLIPCSDDWTRAIAELPDPLRTRYPASVAGPLAIETMTDKWRFAQMLEYHDVPRPKTVLMSSLQELAALPEACFENMFLKPLDSQKFAALAGTKAFQIEGRQHAVKIMGALGPNGEEGFPILLQEYIPGPTTNYHLVDGFVDRHGKTQALIARRRHRMYPPTFGNSTLSETISLHAVREPVDILERIWHATGYRGIFDAEFKYDDRDGHFKILEINARPWWFVEFASRCGLNLCQMAYRDALDLPVEPKMTYPEGRRCVYLLYDFGARRTTHQGFRGSLHWIRSLKGTEEIVYCWDDPGPAVSLSLQALRKKLAGALHALRWPVKLGPRVPSPAWSLNKRDK